MGTLILHSQIDEIAEFAVCYKVGSTVLLRVYHPRRAPLWGGRRWTIRFCLICLRKTVEELFGQVVDCGETCQGGQSESKWLMLGLP